VRNPFYTRVLATGIRIIAPIEAPAHGRRAPSNPYYDRVKTVGGVVLPARPGRPRAGERRAPTAVKSLRLPVALWREIDERARRRRMSRADAVREALGRWLASA